MNETKHSTPQETLTEGLPYISPKETRMNMLIEKVEGVTAYLDRLTERLSLSIGSPESDSETPPGALWTAKEQPRQRLHYTSTEDAPDTPEKMWTHEEQLKFFHSKDCEVYIDFDGTLCKWGYPGMGAPEEGAKGFMQWLTDNGFKPVVYSCRASVAVASDMQCAKQVRDMAAWLSRHEIPYHSIDVSRDGKPNCLCYVDDKAVAYKGNGNWGPVMGRVRHLRTVARERWEKQQ